MNHKLQTQKTTTIRHEITLDRDALLKLLREQLHIPENADVYFQVPGGGDWSNTSVDVDDENPIHVKWTVTTDAENT